MNKRRLLFEVVSIPFIPFGINVASAINSKIMIPLQIIFFLCYLSNLVLVSLELIQDKIFLAILGVHWFIANIFTVATAFRHRRKILLLMQRLISNFPEDKIKGLSRRCIGYVVFFASLAHILTLVSQLDNRKANFNTALNGIFICYKIITSSWHENYQLVSMGFYLMLYDILDFHLSFVIQCLKNYVKRQEKMSIKRVYSVTLHLLKDTDDFDDVMSGFSFIWFSTTFFSGASSVFKTRGLHLTSIYEIIDYYLYPVATNLCLFAVIWLMENKRFNQEKEIENIVSSIALYESNTGIVLQTSTINALQSLANRKMTALRLFTLDRQVLLSFISAFVTFTALFSSLF